MKRLLIGFSILVLAIAACKNNNMQTSKETTMKTAQSGYAPVNGIKMYYEIHGEGKPLVLIHGGGSTIETSFETILPLLAETYKVIAVELQAHGHTSDREAPESFQQDANDVVTLLQHLKINKASFLGFSNGGQTAMQIGISYPNIVDKLIITSAFYKRNGAMEGLFENLEKATINDMPAVYKEAYLKINNDTAALQNMFEKDRARMVAFKDWSEEEVASIKAPTLIIAGNEDVVTPEHAVEMKRKIPNSKLLLLPGNHGSFIGERMTMKENSKLPLLTVEVIGEFLSE